MSDAPIAHTADGRPIYDNTPTVVAVLARSHIGRILVVRRGKGLGEGLLGLPGGYHMRGESWQEAGVREVFEETGVKLDPSTLWPINIVTDEYGNNLIIAGVSRRVPEVPTTPDGVETLEALWLSDAGASTEWAFPRHFAAARL